MTAIPRPLPERRESPERPPVDEVRPTSAFLRRGSDSPEVIPTIYRFVRNGKLYERDIRRPRWVLR